MADPVGLVASILGIVSACTKLGAQIREIRHSFIGVPAAIQSLGVDCMMTAAVLQRLEELLSSRPHMLTGNQSGGTGNLAASFEALVEGLRGSIRLLSEEVARIHGGAPKATRGDHDEGLGNMARAQFVWKESFLKDLHGEIKEQRSSLCFLLDCINTESLVNVQIQLEGRNVGTNSPTSGHRIPRRPVGQPPQDPSQLRMSELSVQPKKASVKVFLPRELDRPDVRVLMERVRLKPGKSYKSPDAYTSQKMHEAIANNNVEKLIRLLADRRHPDSCLPGSDLTPLQRALDHKLNPAVIALVLAGASLSTRTEQGMTPLIWASERAFPYETIKLMCELGADVNAKSTLQGDTALHWAADTPRSERVIMALVSHGADLESRTTADGMTPLFFAVQQKNLTAARKMLDYSADPNALSSKGFTPLYRALELQPEAIAVDFIKLLCERGADPKYLSVYQDKVFTPLTFALRVKSTSSVAALKALLAAGADISGKNPQVSHTPLELALQVDPSMIPFLIEMGAGVGAKISGYLPLHLAVTRANLTTSILERLVRQHILTGLSIDCVSDHGDTPLALAAARNNTDAIRLLVEQGAYVDFQPSNCVTAVNCALRYRSFEAFQLLVELGADLEHPMREAHGIKPVHMACVMGSEDRFISHMLDRGVPVDSRTAKPGSYTPLMFAASKGRIPLIKLLLARGADLHARDGFGDVIHMQAVEHPATLQYLLNLPDQKNGGTLLDPNDANMGGATALHECVFAKENGAMSAKILLRAGARQLSATEFWEDQIKKTGFHRGTPVEMATESGKSDLVELFESWNYQ